MKISEVINVLNAKTYNVVDENLKLDGCYAGDMLTNVTKKANKNCVWLTVLSNIYIAETVLTSKIGLVVLCEGAKCHKDLLQKCIDNNINIISTEYKIYQASVLISRIED